MRLLRVFLSTTALALVVAGGASAGLPPGGSFLDDDASTHEGAIEAIYAAGITRGCGEDTYCPERRITRAELIALVARALDLPEGPDAFSDDNGHPLEVEINAAAAAGVTAGCGVGVVCPAELVTRAQSAAMLVRAFGYPGTATDHFDDDGGVYFEAEIDALAAAGVTLGCGERLFCPFRTLSRAETASLLARALGLDPIEVPPRYPSSCDTGAGDAPGSGFAIAAGESGPLPAGGVEYRYFVEVQEGLAIDPDCFAAAVDRILQDPGLGWGSAGTRTFRRVNEGAVDFRVTLATPATVDQHCVPFDTGGVYSCWNGVRAMINLTRWRIGAVTYGSDVGPYRVYVINHEVGHALGVGHRTCPARGASAPVMVQQSKSLEGCTPNPWPTPGEL